MTQGLDLPIVDARALPAAYRAAMRPGEVLPDEEGRGRRLPVYFYRVDSWEQAHATALAPGFHLWEFIQTDVRAAEVLRGWPRYVPCAVTLLAAHLAVFRQRVGALVHIAANGGYRSPGHASSHYASTHHWGTAANVYRIGRDRLDAADTLERYRAIARQVLPGVFTRPYGHVVGCTDDHLHLDLGYVTLVPRGAPGEEDA